MMCSYRVESSKGVNQSHYRHSMNTKRNYVFYVTQIEKTHIICRTHFVYVSYLYKSYPRMHDMPRVTIVFGKVVDLNQGNEDIYIIVLYIQRINLHCTKLHCKSWVRGIPPFPWTALPCERCNRCDRRVGMIIFRIL